MPSTPSRMGMTQADGLGATSLDMRVFYRLQPLAIRDINSSFKVGMAHVGWS
jgi:hypothetical protein